MRRAAATIVVALLVGCHRAPDEPASTGEQLQAASRVDAGRCLTPTPDALPPPVPPGPAPRCPRDPNPYTLPAATVQFPDATEPARVSAEIARSPEDQTRGLMFRTSMEEDHGMLFSFEEPKVQQFWMHNTCIPLDLLFLDQDGFIVGIVENAPTLNDAPRGVACPSLYVLEVNAGWSRRHGVRAGQRAVLPGA